MTESASGDKRSPSGGVSGGANGNSGRFGSPGRDPSAAGSKGGRSRKLHPDVATPDLREKARATLQEMLESDNESTRLRAASALAAYSPERPVSEAQRKGWDTSYDGVPTTEILEMFRKLNSTGVTIDGRPIMADGQPTGILPSPGEVMAQAEALRQEKEASNDGE